MNSLSPLSAQLIKEQAAAYGADLVGIADIARFDGINPAQDPRFIFPQARSVIGLAFRVPRGLFRGILEGTQYYQYTLLGVKAIAEELSEIVLMKLAHLIENAGYEACIHRRVPNLTRQEDTGTNPEVVQTTRLTHARPVSPDKPAPDVMLDMDLSGVLCGLGELGMSGRLLTPEFGPLQRTAFIITDAVLAADPLHDARLCDHCGACRQACPGGAITADIRSVPVAGRNHQHWSTDSWQCAVYYQGAAADGNPFCTDDTLQGHPERRAILQGKKRFHAENASEAAAVRKALQVFPPTFYGYVGCVCGRACDTACYRHLEERGVLSRKFQTPLSASTRKRETNLCSRKGGELMTLTATVIKEAAERFGADIVGIGELSRFDGTPPDEDPRSIFPQARSIIGLGFRVLRGSLRGVEEGTTFSSMRAWAYCISRKSKFPPRCSGSRVLSRITGSMPYRSARCLI